MITSSFAIFFSLFYSAPAVASNSSHLVVSGSHFGEASRIYNCLSYQKCDYIRTSFEGSATDGRMSLYVPRTEAEILDQLSNCDLSLFHGNAQIEKTDGLHPLKWTSKPNPLNLAPALIGVQDPGKLKPWMNENDQFIGAKKWPQAISSILKNTGWQTSDYEISVDPDLKDYAIVEHQYDTIRLPENDVLSVCDLIFFMRHELEHVQQTDYADECLANEGVKTAFQDHNERDRTAYISDIAGSEAYCPGRTPFLITGRWAYIQANYLHKKTHD